MRSDLPFVVTPKIAGRLSVWRWWFLSCFASAVFAIGAAVHYWINGRTHSNLSRAIIPRVWCALASLAVTFQLCITSAVFGSRVAVHCLINLSLAQTSCVCAVARCAAARLCGSVRTFHAALRSQVITAKRNLKCHSIPRQGHRNACYFWRAGSHRFCGTSPIWVVVLPLAMEGPVCSRFWGPRSNFAVSFWSPKNVGLTVPQFGEFNT